MALLIVGIIIAVIALLVSSVINILIYRAPIKLYHEWDEQATAFLKEYQDPDPSVKRLFSFQSICKHCNKAISYWQHFPLIGFFILRKHSQTCAEISTTWRPFFIALLCVILSLLVFIQYRENLFQLLGLLIFTWTLLLISVIDLDHQLILESVVLPLLWVGLLLNTLNLYVPLRSAVIGAAVGYLLLMIPSKLYEFITSREAIGIGDYKLAAAVGAWVGVGEVITVILSALVFLFIVMVFRMLGGFKYLVKPLSFGPFLSLSAWLVMVYQFNLAYILIRAISRS